jgi:TonB family protein
MAVPVRLKVFKGEELIATRDFERDMIKIGRLSTAHLCLEDDKASRIHSVLNVEGDGKLSIVDMGSVEGTFLNGKRVNKGFVNFGDEIGIGGSRILVERVGEELEGALGEVSRPTEPGTLNLIADGPEPRRPPAPVTAVAPPPERSAVEPAAPRAASPSPVVAQQAPAAAAVPAAVRAAPPPPPPAAPEPNQSAEGRSASGPLVRGPERQAARAPASPQRPRGGVLVDGRHRTLFLHEKPFNTYVPHAPTARRPTERAGALGLQIRYLWGDQILQVSQHGRPEAVFVGTTRRSELRIANDRLPIAEHALATPEGDAWALHLAEGMRGELEHEGQRKPIGPGTHELRPVDFAWVDLGGVIAELSFTSQPKRVVVPLSESVDYRFLNLLVLLLVIGAAFMITASTHTEADLLADDLTAHRLVVAKFLITEAAKPKRNVLLDRLADVKDPMPGEAAERHKGEEGKMGKKDAPIVRQNRSAPKAIDINAKDLVKNSGLLKTLGTGGGGGLSTIFGQGGLGGDLKGAVGNIVGSRVGDSGGFGGLGLKGTGTGGGGMGNTIGIGGIGTRGRGGGITGYGTGVGNLDPKRKADVGITDTDATVQGSLDRELIRKVIRANIGQIRYCYESELQTKPNLAGKVAVRFIISPSGDVAQAQVAEGSTLNEPRLSECIRVRVRGWKFPSPKGGGNVIVTYPFLFKPSGE